MNALLAALACAGLQGQAAGLDGGLFQLSIGAFDFLGAVGDPLFQGLVQFEQGFFGVDPFADVPDKGHHQGTLAGRQFVGGDADGYFAPVLALHPGLEAVDPAGFHRALEFFFHQLAARLGVQVVLMHGGQFFVGVSGQLTRPGIGPGDGAGILVDQKDSFLGSRINLFEKGLFLQDIFVGLSHLLGPGFFLGNAFIGLDHFLETIGQLGLGVAQDIKKFLRGRSLVNIFCRHVPACS